MNTKLAKKLITSRIAHSAAETLSSRVLLKEIHLRSLVSGKYDTTYTYLFGTHLMLSKINILEKKANLQRIRHSEANFVDCLACYRLDGRLRR